MTFSFVDTTKDGALAAELDACKAAGKRVGLVWLESPTNPTLKISDIAAAAAAAHAAGALLAMDNTFCSPALQAPLSLGADIVVHSTTKYIGGHSDTLGGVVVTASDELATRLRFVQNGMGAIMSPFESFLAHRGLKTLALRMERHSSNALDLARWLEAQPSVERVI
jgi:cystathionine beta-lyase/cystathionine gamma-synthase